MSPSPIEPLEACYTETLAAQPATSGEVIKTISTELTFPARYEPLGRIAGGACGEVWRVRDTLLDRVIAIKVLRSEFVDDKRMRARFLAEAQVTAQLQHPATFMPSEPSCTSC